jgi:hypothetical protein
VVQAGIDYTPHCLTLSNFLLHETLQESAISYKFPHLQIAGTHAHLSALILPHVIHYNPHFNSEKYYGNVQLYQ